MGGVAGRQLRLIRVAPPRNHSTEDECVNSVVRTNNCSRARESGCHLGQRSFFTRSPAVEMSPIFPISSVCVTATRHGSQRAVRAPMHARTAAACAACASSITRCVSARTERLHSCRSLSRRRPRRALDEPRACAHVRPRGAGTCEPVRRGQRVRVAPCHDTRVTTTACRLDLR